MLSGCQQTRPGLRGIHEDPRTFIRRVSSVIVSNISVQGCVTGQHSVEAPAVEAPKSANVVYTSPKPQSSAQTAINAETFTSIPTVVAAAPAPPPPEEEEEDDLSVPAAPGTTCRHKGCGKVFVSDELHRIGDGEEATCTYHPKAVSVIINSRFVQVHRYSPVSSRSSMREARWAQTV